MGDAVRYEVTDRVATITLDRPEARNALNTEVLRLLPRYILEAEADDAVDVMILTGADPAFCAGVDLKEAAAGGQGDASDALGAVVESRQGPVPAARQAAHRRRQRRGGDRRPRGGAGL